MIWATSLVKQDTLFIYLTHSFYWQDSTRREVKFTLDSIRGRGASRQAMLTYTVKTPNPALWTRTYIPYGDSVYVSTPTTDSTHISSTWLRYTGPGYGEQEWFMFFGNNTVLSVSMIKVLGDPTKNNGFDQQAMLVFKYKESVRTQWFDWFKGLDTTLTIPQ